MKTLTLTLLLTLSPFALAQHDRMGHEKGNGGSGSESQLFSEEANYSQIISKIGVFFKKHPELQDKFKQVSVKDLVSLTSNINLKVINDTLVDKNGVTRTCLNYSGSNNIECNYAQLQLLKNSPEARFVLMFHELLGLMGVEETTPKNPATIDGYKISKELAPYVTKVANYDLRMTEIQKRRRTVVTDTLSPQEFIGTLEGRFDSTGRKWWIDVLMAPVIISGSVLSFGGVYVSAYTKTIHGQNNGFLQTESMYTEADGPIEALNEFERLKKGCKSEIRKMFPKGTGVLTDLGSVYYEGNKYFCGNPGVDGVEGKLPSKKGLYHSTKFSGPRGNQYFINIYRQKAKLVER